MFSNNFVIIMLLPNVLSKFEITSIKGKQIV